MNYNTVIVSIEDKVGTITLNRPEAKSTIPFTLINKRFHLWEGIFYLYCILYYNFKFLR